MASDSKAPPNLSGKFVKTSGESFTSASGLNDPLVGAQFGPYRIIGRIADGERGEIYFAEEPGINRKVAVKVLREDYCRDQEALKEFHKEIRLVKEMGHDGFAEVYDVGWTTDQRVYLVMERLQGETLQDRMDRGPLPFAEALPIFGQVLTALAALHERGVAHRDLRPDRIFLIPRQDGPPKVKVLGVGVSRLVNLDDLRRRLPKLSATSGGAIAAHYLSPEQIVNKPVDARTDVFAIGIILYEAFAGQLPFAGMGVVQVLAKQAQGQIPPLPELDPQLGVPPEVADLIAKTTRREPQERYPDASALLSVLSDLAVARGLVLAPATPRPRGGPTPMRAFPSPSGLSLPAVNAPSGQGAPMSSGGYPAPTAGQSPVAGHPGVSPGYPGVTPYPGSPPVPGVYGPHPATPVAGHPPISGTYPAQPLTPYPGQPPMSGGYGGASPVMGNQALSQSYPSLPSMPAMPAMVHPGQVPPQGLPEAGQAGLYGQGPVAAPPAPSPAPASSSTSAGLNQWASEKKGGAGLWIGLILVLLIGGTGAYFLFSKEKPTEALPAEQTKEKEPLAWEELKTRSLDLIRKNLDHPKPAIRARAAEVVGLIRDQDRIEELARVRVTDKDTLVRARAAWALGQIGDTSVIPRLRELRETADPSAQLYLDEALFRLGEEAARARLREALDTKDLAIQLRAAKILAELGDEAAIPVLKRQLKSANRESVILEYQGYLAKLGSEEARGALVAALKNDDPILRIQAAEALLEAGFAEGLETLSYLYSDSQSPYRLMAAKAAARPGDTALEKLFVDFLAENMSRFTQDPRASQSAQLFLAEGLALCGSSEEALRSLASLLESPFEEVALTAAGGLIRVKARQPEALQKDALQWAKRALSDTNPQQRARAAALLSYAEAKNAVPLLERALKDPEIEVVKAAVRSLGILGRVDALSDMNPEDPFLAAELGAALLRAKEERGGEVLRQVMQSKNTKARSAAVQASAEAGDLTLAREALEEDPDSEVRLTAAIALAGAGEDTGLAALLRALDSKNAATRFEAGLALWLLGRPEGEDYSPDTLLHRAPLPWRIRAAEVAHRLPVEQAIPFYRRALAAPNVELRRAAAVSLSRLEKDFQDRVLPLYYSALEDADPQVRAAVALAIARISAQP